MTTMTTRPEVRAVVPEDSEIRFGVITRVAPPTTGGNMACSLDVHFVAELATKENGYSETLEPVAWMRQVNLRTPVFHVGEVLILDANGREIPFPGRKPSKWDVDCEEFTDLARALARAREVQAL